MERERGGKDVQQRRTIGRWQENYKKVKREGEWKGGTKAWKYPLSRNLQRGRKEEGMERMVQKQQATMKDN